VRETLTAAAQLRLPSSVDAPTRTLIVSQTLRELGLAGTADTLVGGATRKGISGGERRRLSIGCVLVALPSVLVLDEPTTGLDAFTAFQLLATLARLARAGRTVVLSLHQPRSDAFALFDRVLLLAQGAVVYSGRTRGCLAYFARLGHALPDERTNPLDFLIDVSSVDARDEDAERESRERLARLVGAWRAHQAAEDDKRIEAGAAAEDAEKGGAVAGGGAPGGQAEDAMARRRPNVLQQTRILVPRAMKNMMRGYPELIGHFLQAVILGILMGAWDSLYKLSLAHGLVGITFFRLGEQPSDIQSLKTLAFQSVPVYSYMTQGASDALRLLGAIVGLTSRQSCGPSNGA
jgi:hypothetical protein